MSSDPNHDDEHCAALVRSLTAENARYRGRMREQTWTLNQQRRMANVRKLLNDSTGIIHAADLKAALES